MTTDLGCKDSCIDSLWHNNHSHLGLVALTKQSVTLWQLLHFITSNSSQLSITNTITEHNYTVWQGVVYLGIKAKQYWTYKLVASNDIKVIVKLHLFSAVLLWFEAFSSSFLCFGHEALFTAPPFTKEFLKVGTSTLLQPNKSSPLGLDLHTRIATRESKKTRHRKRRKDQIQLVTGLFQFIGQPGINRH